MFLLGSLLLPVYGYTPEELQQMFSLGLQDIKRETINGPVTLEQGKIPEWLAGKILDTAGQLHPGTLPGAMGISISSIKWSPL